MSKASRYAEAHKESESIRPSFRVTRGRVNMGADFVLTANVTSGGELALDCRDRTLEVHEALKLRDWITETFDDVSDSPNKP